MGVRGSGTILLLPSAKHTKEKKKKKMIYLCAEGSVSWPLYAFKITDFNKLVILSPHRKTKGAYCSL